MPKTRSQPEEIIGKLRHADAVLGQGKQIADVVKVLRATNITYYRCRPFLPKVLPGGTTAALYCTRRRMARRPAAATGKGVRA